MINVQYSTINVQVKQQAERISVLHLSIEH
jgi:hypothetical protein